MTLAPARGLTSWEKVRGFMLGDALYNARAELNSVVKDRLFSEYPDEVKEEVKVIIAQIQALLIKCTSDDLDRKANDSFYKKLK